MTAVAFQRLGIETIGQLRILSEPALRACTVGRDCGDWRTASTSGR